MKSTDWENGINGVSQLRQKQASKYASFDLCDGDTTLDIGRLM